MHGVMKFENKTKTGVFTTCLEHHGSVIGFPSKIDRNPNFAAICMVLHHPVNRRPESVTRLVGPIFIVHSQCDHGARFFPPRATIAGDCFVVHEEYEGRLSRGEKEINSNSHGCREEMKSV